MAKNKRVVGKIMYWLGLAVVVLSHIGILVIGLEQSQVVAHAVFNLIAGVLIFSSAYFK